MVHREAEEVAVGLRSDRRYPPRVRQQTDFAEVRPVRQRGRNFAVRHHDIDYAFLYEVHFRTDCTLLNDDITCKYVHARISDVRFLEMPSRAATLSETFYLAQIENAFTTIDTWLEDFVSEFRHDIRDEIRIGVGEEGYGRHQRSAVVVYHILK